MRPSTVPVFRLRRTAVFLAAVLTAGFIVATGTPKQADAQDKQTFRAENARARQCHARALPGGTTGVDGFVVTATRTGLVRVRLDPVTGRARGDDWDVAVFDRSDQRLVAASAGQRSYELADGYVEAGDQLWVQGCRYAGRATTVKVSVNFYPTPAPNPDDPAQLVTVTAEGRGAKNRLSRLGVELTEAATERTVDVVLHG
jgi:hypothetical protein